MFLNKKDPKYDIDQGIIMLIDKPLTWSSFDVVKRLRNSWCKKLKKKKLKVGHAGTLDPLATGLLIVCIGKATKKIAGLQDGIKGYDGTFFLGATTPSYDLETEVNATFPIEHIDARRIDTVRESMVGPQMQRPPIFSAIQVDGQRAYKAARQGKTLKLEKRAIVIDSFTLTGDLPELDFDIVCSKGTYIRSIAHDFGEALESGAYLKRLRRYRIGDFHIEDAWTMDEFANFMANENL